MNLQPTLEYLRMQRDTINLAIIALETLETVKAVRPAGLAPKWIEMRKVPKAAKKLKVVRLSPEAREKISLAQKKRWAKVKKAAA